MADDSRGATALSIVRRDLHFEPAEICRTPPGRGRRHGARARSSPASARDLVAEEGAIAAVETDAGEIATRAVVLAARRWTAALAATAAAPTRRWWRCAHELFVTGPVAGIDLAQPHVRVMDANAYARPYRDGLMFGAYETAPT